MQALEFMVSSCCLVVSFLHLAHGVAGSILLSRWMNARGVRWLGVSMIRRIRPVRGCPCSCAGLSVIFGLVGVGVAGFRSAL